MVAMLMSPTVWQKDRLASLIGIALLLMIPLVKANAQNADSRIDGLPTAEFHFARLVYANAPGSRRALRGWGNAWQTDYADAEHHLMHGINRLIRIDAQTIDLYGDGGRLIALNDNRLFDYPWLYAVEVGQWYLNDSKAALLREYLDRGGFLLVDDFWGESEWSIFMDSMQRVFPDRPIEVDPIDWTGMDDVGAFLHYSGERADEKETEIA
jgi:hypothetical protein